MDTGVVDYSGVHSITRLSREFDDGLLNQAVTLKSEVEENERFKIQSFQELQDKLPFLFMLQCNRVPGVNAFTPL